jgi:hypothetical protein
MDDRAARYVSIALGVWLFATAFLWQHGPGQFVNAWLMGVIVVVTAALALGVPWFRYLSAAAGVWLIASLFAWPLDSPLTAWNNVFVGAGIVLSSMIGPDEVDISSSDQIQSTG